MWLLAVDAFSGFPVVRQMKIQRTKAKDTIETLDMVFGMFGPPEVLVSDNGTQFTSEDFKIFCKQWGIKHKTGPPYHPQSNGLAERFVRSFKSSMTKALAQDKDLEKAQAEFLQNYRTTVKSGTGTTPFELMFNRPCKTKISSLNPKPRAARAAILKGKERGQEKDKPGHLKIFDIGNKVWTRNYHGAEKWKKGVIDKVLSPARYNVKVGNQVWYRHADSIRMRKESDDIPLSDDEPPDMSEGPPVVPGNESRKRPRKEYIPTKDYALRDRSNRPDYRNLTRTY